ncbi:AMP-dependent synthetase and ligase family protein [Klebsormidium nitens]|uniref:AMP-dependent synthetase and ligase family protein n=1 Tax=Klebsormidium nitens TaxID=105231 RepID=A0A1Y1IMI1_KLENI|nr:AMP-dependent synthetase and ligase family protein [Klebsormidium nitens]|eukprot:GAQ89797.1 AMP-dependent synthetase and ligase family protein [Klebsormidium nitens]
MQRLHPCPCCGYEVFSGAGGTFEICPICFWEDDLYQLTNATDRVGANTVSLQEAQRNFERIGACCPSNLSSGPAMGGAHIGHCLGALSQRRGTSVVTIHGDRKRTGRQLFGRIAELSADLSSSGVAAGDRVALAGLNSDYYLEWLLAVPCAGAIVAPLNHRWSISEAAEAINRIEASLLVLDEFCWGWWEHLRERCPSVRAAVRMETPSFRTGFQDFQPDSQGVRTNPEGVRTDYRGVRTEGKAVRLERETFSTELRSARIEFESVRKDCEVVAMDCRGVQTLSPPNISRDTVLESHLSQERQSARDSSVDRERMGFNVPELNLVTAPGEVALICFTSGTTGAPKAAVLSHTALVTQSLAKIAGVGYSDRDVYLHAAPLCHIGGLSSALGMLMAGATHVFLPRWRVDEAIAAVQAHHVTTFIAVPAMLADIIQAVGDVSENWEGIRTPFWGIRTLLVGGGGLGRMAPDVARLFPNAVIATAYGMTEACSSITFDIVREPQRQEPALPRWITVEPDRPNDAASTFSGSWAVCVGRPAPHLEIRVITAGNGLVKPLENGADSNEIRKEAPSCSQSGLGNTDSDFSGAATKRTTATAGILPQREPKSPLQATEFGSRMGGLEGAHFDPPFREGVIQVRGPNVFSGYWNQPEETANVLSKDGWFSTGDVGYIDNRGRLWLCGREKDMVKTGGENVHAAEVETILIQHPGVAAAAVAGLPDARLGEQVAALLVLMDGWTWGGPVDGQVHHLDAAKMRRHCHQRGLTRYKVPKVFAAQTGPLPVTSTGKVQKNVVRLLLQQRIQRDGGAQSTSLGTRSKL